MDEQQQQRVNQAAEEFANALVESQRTMPMRGLVVEEMNAHLTQQFFHNVSHNLQRITKETQGASQELAEQTQRAQQAAQALSQLRYAKDQEARSASFVDEQQQQRVNQAAEEFANALVESQRTMPMRGVVLEDMNAHLTQQFFHNVIRNLQGMTKETRGASQELAEQTQRAQQAAQALSQGTAGAYMDFMNSLSAMSQGAAQRGLRKPRGEPRK